MNRVNGRVSIIVAIYKVAPYLSQCLDSLVNQTYRDIEVICIDDCGRDGSAEILTEYASKDSRIVAVYQPKNLGLAEVRNHALEKVSGEYLMYCDGDDWLELNACEILVKTMQQYQPDVVMFTYYREYGVRTLKKNIYTQPLIVFDEVACEQLHRRHVGIIGEELSAPQNADAICSLCTKMYRSDIMISNGIRYIDNRIIGTYGDGLVNMLYYGHIKKAVYINEFLYHYRKTNQSSQTTKYKEGFPALWNNLYDIMQKYIDDNSYGPEYNEALNNRIAIGVIGLGFNELHSNKSGKEKRGALHAILNDPRYSRAIKELNIAPMPIHWKVFFICCKLQSAYLIYYMLKTILKLKEMV